MDPVFKCSHCSALFENQRNLSRHQYNHNTSFWFSCLYCMFTTKRKDNLKRHSMKYHNSSTNSRARGLSINADQTQPLNRFNNAVVQTPNPTQTENADHFTELEFDKRLQLPHNFIYAGATQSGKTTLLLNTLENATAFYEPPPSRIYFLHNCFQENYEKLKKKLCNQGIQIKFIKKSTVSETDLENMSDQNGGQTLIIIDDNSISAASSKDVAQVFTIARHKNCSIVLLLHFIFGPWPSSRIISANTSYFFLLKSPRMTQQISTLGLQLGKQSELVSAYAQASKQTYGFVLVDLCTNTPDNFRIRTDIFDREEKKSNDNSFIPNNSQMIRKQFSQHVKTPATAMHKLEKKSIHSSDNIENIRKKRAIHRQERKHSGKVLGKKIDAKYVIPFANMHRPYI